VISYERFFASFLFAQNDSYLGFLWLSQKGKDFSFQQLFTPSDSYQGLKGEVAENQPPFRGGVRLILCRKHF
jgi:hypothetical protein